MEVRQEQTNKQTKKPTKMCLVKQAAWQLIRYIDYLKTDRIIIEEKSVPPPYPFPLNTHTLQK